MSEPKKLFIKTYGCQMNVYDSERMAETLGAEGYVDDRPRRRRRHGAAEHLPHPREGGGKGLFRSWPAAPAEAGEPRT